MANGNSANQCEEYVRLGESTSLECLRRFCRGVIEVFGKRYLRRPNESDVQRLLEHHLTKHRFPGMLGSIDCMHWAWKNCPVAWRGQYTRGDHGHPTIMHEAIALQDLWIWHAYFGVASSNNDINIINQSLVFNQVLEGTAHPCNFIINGSEYTTGYYLADNIYHECSTIVKSFTKPGSQKMVEFTRRHESARKDIERAFGVLQARWAIIRGPARRWSTKLLSDIMYACIVLHNMIVEDRGNSVAEWSDDENEDTQPANHGPTFHFVHHISRIKQIRNSDIHHTIRYDLMKHIWSLKLAHNAE